MRSPKRSMFGGANKILSNYHFWVILFIIFVLCFIYYVYYYAKNSLFNDWLEWFRYIHFFEISNGLNASLFYIPIIYAAIVLSWRGTLIVWFLSIVVILPYLCVLLDHSSLITNMLFLLVPLLVGVSIVIEFKWREMRRQIAVERETERQTCMFEILKAQEKERQRIAQELHDDTTQTLLAVANRAQALVSSRDNMAPAGIQKQAEWIRDEVIQVSEDLRKLSLDFSPSVLDNLGLTPALRWLVDRLNNEDGINTEIAVKGVNRKLTSEVDIAIFRIVQEALNNIKRHSQATKADVIFEFFPDAIKVVVQDNGKGFVIPENDSELINRGKLGINGMKQRAKFLGGNITFDSEYNKGTTVTLEIKI